MSKLLRDCWHCDLCGHAWIIVNAEIIPAQCPRCRHRGWNKGQFGVRQISKQSARRTLRKGEILRFTILTGKDDLPLDTDFRVDSIPEGDAEDFFRTKHKKGKRFATVGLEVIEPKPKQTAQNKPKLTHINDGNDFSGVSLCGVHIHYHNTAYRPEEATCEKCKRIWARRHPSGIPAGWKVSDRQLARWAKQRKPEHTAPPADEKKAFIGGSKARAGCSQASEQTRTRAPSASR